VSGSAPASGSARLQVEEPQQGSVKKARTTSSRSMPSRVTQDTKGSDARISKATTAAAVMGFQSSVNRLTDVISERMVIPEDPVVVQRRVALEMLRGEDADLPFAERVMIQQVIALSPAAADLYGQERDRNIRRAFIRSMAERLGVQPVLPPPPF